MVYIEITINNMLFIRTGQDLSDISFLINSDAPGSLDGKIMCYFCFVKQGESVDR